MLRRTFISNDHVLLFLSFLLLLLHPRHYGSADSTATLMEALKETPGSASDPKSHGLGNTARESFGLASTCVPGDPGGYIRSTARVMCPCFVQYRMLTSNLSSSATVDFLLMTEASFQVYAASDFQAAPPFVPEFSRSGRKANNFVNFRGDDFYVYVSEFMEFQVSGEFRVVMRGNSGSPLEDCDTRLSTVFEAHPTPCQKLLEDKVVGGVKVDSEVGRSFMVAVTDSAGRTCSGSLIARDWVLTAAHCMQSRVSYVRVGGSTRDNGELYSVAKTVRHPSFSPAEAAGSLQFDDLGLLKLARPVSGNVTLLKISSNPILDSGSARASGYGQISEEWKGNTALRQVDLPILPFDSCRSTLGTSSLSLLLNKSRHVCAGYVEGGCSVCFGDSGGPLFKIDRDTDTYYQIGIVSAGKGCARPNLLALFTRVSTFASWIKEKTGDEIELFAGQEAVSNRSEGMNEPNEQAKRGGLSLPATVGVVIGAVFGASASAALVLVILRRRS